MKLCDCAVCGVQVPRKRYQAPTARTCSPACARVLAVREHPDIESHLNSGRWGSRSATSDPEVGS